MAWINVRAYGAKGDGSTDDITAINNALQNEDEVVLDNGVYIIGSSIIIPSNTSLYFKNCEIKLATGVFDNIIRNKNQSGDSNIIIQGLGNVVLNQNATENNGIGYWGKSQPDSWRCLGIFLCNVEAFTLAGYTLTDYQAWGHLLQGCSNGNVFDIMINLIKSYGNQDGIDVGHGSHDIKFSNIRGRSGDDFIAIVDWDGGDFVNRDYMVGDTYNLEFDDMLCHFAGVDYFRLLAGDGGTIKNITITNIESRYSARNYIITGQDTYPATPPTNADISDITVGNFTIADVGVASYVFELLSPCQNIIMTNVVNNSGKNLITTNRTPENVYINGVQYY